MQCLQEADKAPGKRHSSLCCSCSTHTSFFPFTQSSHSSSVGSAGEGGVMITVLTQEQRGTKSFRQTRYTLQCVHCNTTRSFTHQQMPHQHPHNPFTPVAGVQVLKPPHCFPELFYPKWTIDQHPDKLPIKMPLTPTKKRIRCG